MFKVNNKNTRKWFEICSKLIIKTLERQHCNRSNVFIVDVTLLRSLHSFIVVNHKPRLWIKDLLPVI